MIHVVYLMKILLIIRMFFTILGSFVNDDLRVVCLCFMNFPCTKEKFCKSEFSKSMHKKTPELGSSYYHFLVFLRPMCMFGKSFNSTSKLTNHM
uniref:Uncharacterized protein n=1 Tax=Lotus japonicus TaxID=34305 RepID=I3SUC6_LOTJA|nr:unknown [Lotus japonicus]